MTTITLTECILAELTGSPKTGEHPHAVRFLAWDLWARARRQFVADDHVDTPATANGSTEGGGFGALPADAVHLEAVHFELLGTSEPGKTERHGPNTRLSEEMWDNRYRTLGELISSAQAMLATIDLDEAGAALPPPRPAIPPAR